MEIDWEKAVYSGITTYQVETPFKGSGTQGITITGAKVESVVNNRRFQLRIEGIYLLDGKWKTAAINGLTEITKQ